MCKEKYSPSLFLKNLDKSCFTWCFVKVYSYSSILLARMHYYIFYALLWYQNTYYKNDVSMVY